MDSVAHVPEEHCPGTEADQACPQALGSALYPLLAEGVVLKVPLWSLLSEGIHVTPPPPHPTMSCHASRAP